LGFPTFEQRAKYKSSFSVFHTQCFSLNVYKFRIDNRVQHEAGHFLVAYLLGVLPKGYTITSLDTLSKQGSLNVQAGTAFVDYEFLEEINTGKLSATVRVP